MLPRFGIYVIVALAGLMTHIPGIDCDGQSRSRTPGPATRSIDQQGKGVALTRDAMARAETAEEVERARLEDCSGSDAVGQAHTARCTLILQ
jgi:hypothetical protein